MPLLTCRLFSGFSRNVIISPAQSFTLTNTGEGDLKLDRITVTEDFLQSNNCGAVLKVGSNCAIEVVFAPEVAGPRSGRLLVTAGGSPYHAALGGTGIPIYDSAIRVQYGSMHLVYPESTELRVCIDSSKRVAATGTFEVYDGSRLLTRERLKADGCAYWYISPALRPGTHHLSVRYSGDKHHSPGVSAPTAIVVDRAPKRRRHAGVA
jgi:hypothetical protein